MYLYNSCKLARKKHILVLFVVPINHIIRRFSEMVVLPNHPFQFRNFHFESATWEKTTYSDNQTWLAGKSTRNWSFNRTFTYRWSIFRHVWGSVPIYSISWSWRVSCCQSTGEDGPDNLAAEGSGAATWKPGKVGSPVGSGRFSTVPMIYGHYL